jgi:hypothetical protein
VITVTIFFTVGGGWLQRDTMICGARRSAMGGRRDD